MLALPIDREAPLTGGAISLGNVGCRAVKH
ncbi:uncharacterized protein METZ01_LOCUS103360 [marine metagenome]|uniref:Uncharacterized protein n=1 Tax=marine metagenome TaxID=408172 RepID=A0A381WD95_9ZZZZ